MIVVEPQNTVHVIGQATPLFFNCSIGNLVRDGDLFAWYEYITDTVYGRIIANDFNTKPAVQLLDGLESEYGVERSNLIVKDANLDDAGTYGCTSTFAPQTKRRVEAVVLSKFILYILYVQNFLIKVHYWMWLQGQPAKQ